MLRYIINISGIVQGVGFRPFVYNLAMSYGLYGFVKNIGSSVLIDIEGNKNFIDEFVNDLNYKSPILSKIDRIDVKVEAIFGYTSFEILNSDKLINSQIYISPDVSVCKDCENEILDCGDRRYNYPFANCTNCGPRFTIIKEIPYDRANTTMHEFIMCDRCLEEYKNPINRRYHAQPISCHDCGPSLFIYGQDKIEIKIDSNQKNKNFEIIKKIINLILDGNILAIKGLGGYHLVCDAKKKKSVAELRERKTREDKPFALMAKDIDIIKKYCYMDSKEQEILNNYKKPIVLLEKRKNIDLPEEVAPNNNYLGFMLPYTPLHTLLFNSNQIELLVMTSGNISSEPIFYKDELVLKGLRNVADYFIVNNREIFIRTDDSVTRVFNGDEYILRRSRGYVPSPIKFELGVYDTNHIPIVLACGGELKNTFCINKGNNFYISHHIGDLENLETYEAYINGIQHFKDMLNVEPAIIAFDLHNGYLSTKYAKGFCDKNLIGVQHHHAHIASCMVDNGIDERVIGVAFDGTGLGEDNNIWGGEFFIGNFNCFKRIAHFEYINMPGGEMAIREPWRMALAYIWNSKALFTSVDDGVIQIVNMFKERKLFDGISREKIELMINIIEKKINTPLTSSVGRLFEAVSAILGIRNTNNYEGQAAIELEFQFESFELGYYKYSIELKNNIFQIKTADIFKGILDDLLINSSIRKVSSKFHETMAQIVLDICKMIRKKENLYKVMLSGGVFQNMVLLKRCVEILSKEGFFVYKHKNIPTNDGGIAIGQSVIALNKYINKNKINI